jgi:hypothetical protein
MSGSTGNIPGLGDGAEWIWNIIRDVFGNVRECLDVYHALEHLSDTGKILYGEGTVDYKLWKEMTKGELRESGFAMVEKRLEEWEKEVKDNETLKKESLRLLQGYFGNHENRLCYLLLRKSGRTRRRNI